MSYFEWRPYVSVAEKKRQAAKRLKDLQKKGRSVAPVTIEGRKIAESFWGVSWCSNLERYSDYATRLPRGRSYVRNGCVVDLQIAKGRIVATVSGSDLYDVEVTIAPVAAIHWRSICRDCAGSIDSLVELLQGRMDKSVMDRVCRQGDGLFPAPKEIKLTCSCPDWAGMCKHVAAVLYGIGARLDRQPQLLFVLRGVDESELLAGADRGLAGSKSAPASSKVLDDGDVAALFGLEMAEGAAVGEAAPAKPESARPAKRAKRRTAERTTALAAKEPGSQRAVRTKANGVAKAKGRAKKKIGRRRKKASR